MFGIGGGELVGIALVALLIFGPKQIPIIMRNLKVLQKEFNRLRGEMNSTMNEVRREIDLAADLGLDDKQPPKVRKAEGATPRTKVEPGPEPSKPVDSSEVAGTPVAALSAREQLLVPDAVDDYLAGGVKANADDYLAEGSHEA